MRLAREVEKRLERFVDGLSATLFRGRMHPVDIADRLVREADLAATEGAVGPQIPNRWEVRMDPDDLDVTAMHDLAAELTHALEATAAERGWRTGGPVAVDVVPDPSVHGGGLAIGSQAEPGGREPWGHLIAVGSADHHALADNRMLVGRGEEADIRVAHPEVSRRHAVLFREGGRAWVHDLGSANGTRVNGTAPGGADMAVRPGDTVAFGPAEFSFRLRT